LYFLLLEKAIHYKKLAETPKERTKCCPRAWSRALCLWLYAKWQIWYATSDVTNW